MPHAGSTTVALPTPFFFVKRWARKLTFLIGYTAFAQTSPSEHEHSYLPGTEEPTALRSKVGFIAHTTDKMRGMVRVYEVYAVCQAHETDSVTEDPWDPDHDTKLPPHTHAMYPIVP